MAQAGVDNSAHIAGPAVLVAAAAASAAVDVAAVAASSEQFWWDLQEKVSQKHENVDTL